MAALSSPRVALAAFSLWTLGACGPLATRGLDASVDARVPIADAGPWSASDGALPWDALDPGDGALPGDAFAPGDASEAGPFAPLRTEPSPCENVPGALGASLCWENPLPHGYSLEASCVSEGGGAWFFGNGFATHFDGARWSTLALPGVRVQTALCRSARDLWAAGDLTDGTAAALHWDGALWTPVNLSSQGRFTALAASDDGALWGLVRAADASSDALVRYDGARWATVDASGAGLGGLWFGPSGELWSAYAGPGACDFCAAVFQRRGASSWSELDVPRPRDAQWDGLTGLFGVGRAEAWAVGGSGSALRFNGARWIPAPIPDSVGLTYHALWGANGTAWAFGGTGLPEDTRVAIARWDGDAWSVSRELLGGTLHTAAGLSPTDLWAAGTQGTILHWNGSAWARPSPTLTQDLLAVSAVSPTEVWAAGRGGTLARYDGARWTLVDSSTSSDLTGVVARSPSDVWIAGQGGALRHWDGAHWTQHAGGGEDFLALRGTPDGNVWALAERMVVRWDGARWSDVTPRALLDGGAMGQLQLRGVWASGADDVWLAAGFWGLPYGATLHWNGSAWERVGGSADGVWGTGRGTVWTWGRQGLTRYEGTTAVASEGGAGLLWGTGPSDVWGLFGAELRRYEGGAWRSYGSVGPLEGLNGGSAIVAASAVGGRFWMVGNGGAILRYASP